MNITQEEKTYNSDDDGGDDDKLIASQLWPETQAQNMHILYMSKHKSNKFDCGDFVHDIIKFREITGLIRFTHPFFPSSSTTSWPWLYTGQLFRAVTHTCILYNKNRKLEWGWYYQKKDSNQTTPEQEAKKQTNNWYMYCDIFLHLLSWKQCFSPTRRVCTISRLPNIQLFELSRSQTIQLICYFGLMKTQIAG